MVTVIRSFKHKFFFLIWWGWGLAQGILWYSFNVSKDTFFISFSDVAVQFEELQGLFEVDPLLLHVFIYISPKEALPAIIKRIPIYISISWFLYLMEHNFAQVCYA